MVAHASACRSIGIFSLAVETLSGWNQLAIDTIKS